LMKKEISIWLFLIWLAFWIVVAVIDIFPEIIAYIAFYVGVGRGVDLVLYLAIFTLLYTVFKFYIRINKIEKNISEIVRKVAIEKTEERGAK